MSKLRECPNRKCWSNNVYTAYHAFGLYYVFCDECGMCGPKVEPAKEAEVAWNALPREIVYSSERPKVEGWYWIKHRDGWCRIWDFDDDAIGRELESIVEYAGPIAAPREPEPVGDD